MTGDGPNRWTMPHESFKRILVPTDGSDNAGRAVKVAIDLAKRYEAEIMILHVIQVPHNLLAASSRTASATILDQYYRESGKEGQKIVDNALSIAKSQGATARGKVLDKPTSLVEGITNFAVAEKVDLIVMGTRGLSGFKKLLMGSVSSGVLSHTICSVLIVR